MATTTDTSQTSATSTDSTQSDATRGQTRSALSDNIAAKSFWRNDAPKGIAGKDSTAIWTRHLAKRRKPQMLADLCNAKSSPLSWGVTLAELSPRTVELLALSDQLAVTKTKGKSRVSAETVEQILAGWLEGPHTLPHSLDYALECLVVAHALPVVAEQVTPDFWWAMADALWQIVQSSQDWRCDAELPPEQGVAQQILSGELPLTLAYLFPEIRPLSKLRNVAYEILSEGIAELANGSGLMQGSYLGYQRPLLACWTRCRTLGQQQKKGCWNKKAEEQYQWAVTHAIGLSTSLGEPMLGTPHREAWSREFLATAVSFSGDPSDANAAKSILGKKLTSAVTTKSSDEFPEPSDNCEWAGLAYMRTDWDRKAATVAIDYSSPDLQLECWVGSQRLLHGTWIWETTLNGKRLEPVGTWDESCWFSDDDVDYLELSIELTGGARLERQILLARDEMFLLLADYVMDTNGGKIVHRYRLPMDSEVELKAEEETRDGLLVAGKTVGRVLPLALPEWRADPRVGQLTETNGHLQLEQEREGERLACPLLIDLNRSRAKKQCTWRQLTVAQSLEVQPHDVAVGYRAQCGKDQWLIYRSLAAPANRTLLGQNLSNECLVARFLPPEGEVDELLEIE